MREPVSKRMADIIDTSLKSQQSIKSMVEGNSSLDIILDQSKS
jgi:hypothetical protein